MIIVSSFSTKTNSVYAKQTFINFFHSFILIHFKLPWITSLSNLSNCLLGEGKTCFCSTNNNVLLLFSKDISCEGIIVDKCFIFNFILHFYELHTNVGTFTCHHNGIYGQKFYINPKILSHQLFIPQCSVHLSIHIQCGTMRIFFQLVSGSTVTYLHFCQQSHSTSWSTTCNVRYTSATRLVNLGLPKAVIRLFCM